MTGSDSLPVFILHVVPAQVGTYNPLSSDGKRNLQCWGQMGSRLRGNDGDNFTNGEASGQNNRIAR